MYLCGLLFAHVEAVRSERVTELSVVEVAAPVTVEPDKGGAHRLAHERERRRRHVRWWRLMCRRMCRLMCSLMWREVLRQMWREMWSECAWSARSTRVG